MDDRTHALRFSQICKQHEWEHDLVKPHGVMSPRRLVDNCWWLRAGIIELIKINMERKLRHP